MLKIALAGNPNSGKTTLFNLLTGSDEYVGNRAGVTVDFSEKKAKESESVITDLPGVYSLSPYSDEEIVTRNYILENSPDVIIDVIDSTNLERSLNLALQLSDTGIPTILALNMTDSLEKGGGSIDGERLSSITGFSVVEISASKGKGIDALMEAIKTPKPSKPLKFDLEIEDALLQISAETGITNRFELIEIFMRDKKTENPRLESIIKDCEKKLFSDSESLIIKSRYDYIESVVAKCLKKPKESPSHKIDDILLNKFLCFPIMLAVLFLVYFLAASGPVKAFSDFLGERFFGEIVPVSVSHALKNIGTADWLVSLICEGIIGGVGAVLSFLPQLTALFLALSLLEECGYMARIAFALDCVFRKIGLSGKSAISFLVSTGCGAMGVMASRNIEQSRERQLTAATACFMPCSAKLPIVILIGAKFLNGAWWILPFAYILGIFAIVVTGLLAGKIGKAKNAETSFLMELPPYHLPNSVNVAKQISGRLKSFIKKAGTVIFLGSTAVWVLSNFDFTFRMVLPENSMLAALGQTISPVFAPIGFGDWKSTCAVLSGFIAKENVASTLEILGQSFTQSSAVSFLAFNLLCPPCVAAISAVCGELNSKRKILLTLIYQTLFAYAVSFLIRSVLVCLFKIV